jgi:hypothetical protein
MSDTTSKTPAPPTNEHVSDRNKREAGERAAVGMAERKRLIAAANDSSNDEAGSVRKVWDNPVAGAVPFANRAEMTAAMKDPRYKAATNAGDAYRAAVAQRIAAAPRFAQAPIEHAPDSNNHQRSINTVSRTSVTDRNADLKDEHLKFPGALPFASRTEQSDAFKDPRYSRDGAYRALLAARLLATR